MDKQELLKEINDMAQNGSLSQAEVMEAFSGTPGVTTEPAKANSLRLSEILYYIGGGIVFLGICVLVYQNWDNFDSFLKIFITLGSFIAAYAVGVLFYRYEDLRKVSQAFFLLAGCLGPLALYVTFNEWGFDTTTNLVQFLIFLILTFVFLGGLFFFRQQVILLFFGILFATAIFHVIISLIVGDNLLQSYYTQIWEYRILAAGLAWSCLGFYLTQTSYKALAGVMYGFGSFGFLAAALALGGWQPNQNVFWELFYPIVVFGTIFASVYIKSKSFLTFGTIFLMAYILKITGEYFTSGLGWPLALVLAGLVIMGVGYWAVRLNRKYFTALA